MTTIYNNAVAEIIEIENNAIHTHQTFPIESMLATNHQVRSTLFIRPPKQGQY
jgi:predicted ABC-type ATPase